MEIELSEGLFIRLPDNIEKLGIGVVERKEDKKFPEIILIKGERTLSIWQWTNFSEITIGKNYYKIEGSFLVPLHGRAPQEFPLKTGERGEKIIDLLLIAKKNKKVAKFFELSLS